MGPLGALEGKIAVLGTWRFAVLFAVFKIKFLLFLIVKFLFLLFYSSPDVKEGHLYSHFDLVAGQFSALT